MAKKGDVVYVIMKHKQTSDYSSKSEFEGIFAELAIAMRYVSIAEKEYSNAECSFIIHPETIG